MTVLHVDALDGTKADEQGACASVALRTPALAEFHQLMTSTTGESQLAAGSQYPRLPGPFKNAYNPCSELSPLVQLLSPPAVPLLTMERIKQLTAHLTGTTSGLSALEVKRPDDVVITMAIRSPLCKAKKGGFKDARYDR